MTKDILQTIQALAWPMATIVIILLVKKDLVSLLSRLKSIKLKDVDVELESKLETIRSAIVDESKEMEGVGAGISREAAIIEGGKSPLAAIRETWSKIEQAIQQYAVQVGIVDQKDAVILIEELRKAGKISKNQIQIFNNLYELRVILSTLIEISESDKRKVEEFLRSSEIFISTIS
jgi:hypothetical protein